VDVVVQYKQAPQGGASSEDRLQGRFAQAKPGPG
jgi:hypothetical protein